MNLWAATGKGTYLHYGMKSGLEELIPGITVRVLGPPTVDQHAAVARQRKSDPSEFWMLYQGILRGLRPENLLGPTPGDARPSESTTPEQGDDEPATGAERDLAEDEAPMPSDPIGSVGPVRWLTDRMGRQQLNSLLRIVRILDDVLNNTSIILLIEIPGSDRILRLLFGGDAQIENWEYALKYSSNRRTNLSRLRQVDLYKVGHHGSRNATPRTLFNLWREPETMDRDMVALLSTKAGVHGKSPATKVPRKTLKAALDTRMKLYSTEDLDSETPYVEMVADFSAGGGFVQVDTR